MIGYILKDAPKSQADGFVSADSAWRFKLRNVTAAQITKGIELNAMYGAGEFKNQVFLTRHNLMERCCMFVKMHEKGIALRGFSDIVASMIHTGSYHLATEFGMAGVKFDRQKTEILFRMRMVPLSVDVGDVEKVMFGGGALGGLGSLRRVGPLVGANAESSLPLGLASPSGELRDFPSYHELGGAMRDAQSGLSVHEGSSSSYVSSSTASPARTPASVGSLLSGLEIDDYGDI